MHGKSWMTLRTTNGIKFRSAEDNIMHLGALTEAHCSELGGHQLETSKKHGGVTHTLTVSCEDTKEVNAILGCLRF